MIETILISATALLAFIGACVTIWSVSNSPVKSNKSKYEQFPKRKD